MGWLNPKNPFADAPAKTAKPSRSSRRQRANEKDNTLIAFCDASTALHRARQDHGWNSPQAKAAKTAFDNAPRPS